TGSISFSTNSSTDWPIIFCSSVISSGVNTCSGEISSSKKLAPFTFSRVLMDGPPCIVFYGMDFNQAGPDGPSAAADGPPVPSGRKLEHAGCSHAAADAHGNDPVLSAPARHFVQHLHRQFGAGAAERVAEGNGSAVDVDFVQIQIQLPYDGHR